MKKGAGLIAGSALFFVGDFCRINPFFISTADSSAMTWYTFVALVVVFAVLAAILIAIWLERR
jgi:hypothetical protein